MGKTANSGNNRPDATVKVGIMHSWMRKNRVRIIVITSILLTLLLAGLVDLSWNYFNSMQPLTERLGFSRNDRLLIINADDGGLCHEANQAIVNMLEHGSVTSSSVMATGPALKELAAEVKRNPKLDLGVHLTHTCEWPTYRWQTVLPQGQTPGLSRPDGTMWEKTLEAQSNASSQEAYRESKAQIEKIMALGIQPTHLDSHMGVMQMKFSYFLQYIRLGWQYNLPLRMPSRETLAMHNAGFLRVLTRALGIVTPDNLILSENDALPLKEHWLKVLHNLQPGVTEIYIHPAREGELLKKITPHWQRRVEEYKLFLNDPDIRRTLQDRRIILIGYRTLFNLQRGIKQ